jgi:hypothetical protein
MIAAASSVPQALERTLIQKLFLACRDSSLSLRASASPLTMDLGKTVALECQFDLFKWFVSMRPFRVAGSFNVKSLRGEGSFREAWAFLALGTSAGHQFSTTRAAGRLWLRRTCSGRESRILRHSR